MIGRNLLTQETPIKVEFKYILFCKLPFGIGLCILYVKMKTFLCEESVMRHNKRNCFGICCIECEIFLVIAEFIFLPSH